MYLCCPVALSNSTFDLTFGRPKPFEENRTTAGPSQQQSTALGMSIVRALGNAVMRVLGFLWWLAVGLVLTTALGIAVMGVWPVWVWITACAWSVYNIAAGSAQGLLHMLGCGVGASAPAYGGMDGSLRKASAGNDGAASDGPSSHHEGNPGSHGRPAGADSAARSSSTYLTHEDLMACLVEVFGAELVLSSGLHHPHAGGAAAEPHQQVQQQKQRPSDSVSVAVAAAATALQERRGVLTRLSSSMHRGKLPALQLPPSFSSALPLASASVSASARPLGTTSMPLAGRSAFASALHTPAPSSLTLLQQNSVALARDVGEGSRMPSSSADCASRAASSHLLPSPAADSASRAELRMSLAEESEEEGDTAADAGADALTRRGRQPVWPVLEDVSEESPELHGLSNRDLMPTPFEEGASASMTLQMVAEGNEEDHLDGDDTGEGGQRRGEEAQWRSEERGRSEQSDASLALMLQLAAAVERMEGQVALLVAQQLRTSQGPLVDDENYNF